MSNVLEMKIPTKEQVIPIDKWRTVKFGDIAQKVDNIVDRENCDLDKYVAGEHMRTDDFHIKEWGIISDDYLGPAFNHKFVKGQILYGSRRTYLRKVAIPHFDGICANTTFVIEPKGDELIPELLPFVMQSTSFNEHSIKNSKGSTNPYVNWKDIEKYEFAVPPKNEQHCMAKILWAAENCIVKNEKFAEEAERTKRVLMRDLFMKGIMHKKFQKVKKIGSIPIEWDILKLKDLTEIITKGSTPTSYGFKYQDHGINFVKVESISQNGNFIFNNFEHIDSETNDAFSRSILEENDILFSIAGALGRCAVVNKDILPANINQALAIIRLNKKNQNIIEYLKYYLEGPIIQRHIKSIAITTAQPNLNLSHLEDFLICLPEPSERYKIVSILNRISETIAVANENVNAAKVLKMSLINHFLSGGIS